VAVDHGYDRTGSYWTGLARRAAAAPVSRQIVTDSLTSPGALTVTMERLDAEVSVWAKADPRVKVLTALPGSASSPHR
jgi:hypothetical protein